MFSLQNAVDSYMISQIVGGTVALFLMIIGIYAAFHKDGEE